MTRPPPSKDTKRKILGRAKRDSMFGLSGAKALRVYEEKKTQGGLVKRTSECGQMDGVSLCP